MQDWTRSEVIGFIAVLISFVAALAGIAVIQSKFWRNTFFIFIAIIIITCFVLFLGFNLKTETPQSNTGGEVSREIYLRKHILGKWYDPQRNNIEVFEFTETGNFNYAPAVKTKHISTYKILDADHIEVNFIDSIYPFSFRGNAILDVRLDEDNLVLIANPQNPANIQIRDKTGAPTLNLTRMPWYIRLVVSLDR